MVEHELKLLDEERQQVRAAIKEQNLSEDEVVRMTSDQDSYSKLQAQLTTKLQEVKEKLHGLEVAITHRTEAVEEEISAYMTLLSKCGLHPSPPEPVENVNFAIDLNTAKSDPREMTDTDIRGTVKPALLKFKTSQMEEKMRAQTNILDLEEVLEKLQTQSEDIKDKIAANNEERNLTQEQIETMKEVRIHRLVLSTV